MHDSALWRYRCDSPNTPTDLNGAESYLEQNGCRGVDEIELLEVAGEAGTVAFEADTGIMRKLVHGRTGVDLCAEKRSNQLGQIGGLRIWDDLDRRWWDDFEHPGKVENARLDGNVLEFDKFFDGCPFTVRQRIEVGSDKILWNVEVRQDRDVDRGLRIVRQVPLVAGWNYFAPCLDGRRDENGETGDCAFDGSTFFNFMYHVGPYYNAAEITLPLFSLYDKRRDTGFQFAAPADAEIPALWFEYGNRGGFAWGSQRKDTPAYYPHLDIVHNFIGLHGTKPCFSPLEIYVGRGDYRPLLGQYVEAYHDMFFPRCEAVWERTGIFQCGGLFLAEDDEKREFYKAIGGKYLELHGHFPYYGQYWNEGEWGSIAEYERRRLEQEGSGGSVDANTIDNPPAHSQERMLSGIRKLQEDGISVHIYFNFTDGDRDLHTPKIPDSINKDEDGNPWPSGWRYCHNINAWPGSSAFEDFVGQARNLMNHYPADGFFFDCFRHYDFDFAHSDGITMVNNKRASCVNFSMAKLAEAIMKEAHALGKDSFANKPRTILSMGHVDGMLLEGDGGRAEMYYYYTTLAKPNFYMWGHGVRDIEECLKRCVTLAAWPNTPEGEDKQALVELYSKYLPLYEHFRRRVFCFEPNPLRLDYGLEGELYTVGKDYAAGIMVPFRSWKDEPCPKSKKVGVVVEKADYVSRVLVHYCGEDVPREAPVYRAGEQVVVPLPLLNSACVVRLEVGEKPNKDQEPFEAVTDYFDSCGDPVSAFEHGSGAKE